MKNQSSSSSPSLSWTNIVLILLILGSFTLGIYFWTHQQILINIEKTLNQHESKFKALQNQNQNLKTQVEDQIKALNQPSPVLEDHPSFSQSEATKFNPLDNTKFPTFDKLIGMQAEKKMAHGFIDFTKNKSKYQHIGEVDPPLGILLSGIPGTGKTTFARALAKETNLPFFEVSSALFSQKYKGIAPQMVQDLFNSARAIAPHHQGAIIFLDECETIFSDIGSLEADSELANVVNAFKTELTSLNNNTEYPLFIIGATNHADKIDTAIKSRFTYNIEVQPGNQAERKAFLEFMIAKRQNPYNDEAKQYLYEIINAALERLTPPNAVLKANRTLENLLKEAVIIFAENRAIKTINDDQTETITFRETINKADLKTAFKNIITPNTQILDTIEMELKNASAK
ncbi:AAA family ATPase [Candidatus Phytoplasma prunorum]|uniref:AAA family ATPase n=1 Tax=Candidatus Phytoplasma prunorum TaxID=47565 RepID=UPI002FF141EE